MGVSKNPKFLKGCYKMFVQTCLTPRSSVYLGYIQKTLNRPNQEAFCTLLYEYRCPITANVDKGAFILYWCGTLHFVKRLCVPTLLTVSTVVSLRSFLMDKSRLLTLTHKMRQPLLSHLSHLSKSSMKVFWGWQLIDITKI